MAIPSEADRQCRRIFCVGRNYANHIRELGGATQQQRFVVFMKPPTSLVAPQQAVTLPRAVGEVHHEVELVLLLKHGGRDIGEQRARSCVGAIALGIDLTLRDVQHQLKNEGLPWESAKAFEQSALIGPLKALEPTTDLTGIDLQCEINGELRQRGNTQEMIFSPNRIINLLSATWNLREGDLIYTGTPSGVGPVTAGDTVTARSSSLEPCSWHFV